MATQDIPVGIDLGTTYSAIAFLDQQGKPTTISNSEGELTTPSVVFFDRDAVIVGAEASFAGESDVSRLARAAKRDMGQRLYRKSVLNHQLPPEVVQAYVLKKLKADAELKLGVVNKAVITVPAYFNEPRRKATQDAGELAGIEVVDIINEPTAAALAYGVQRGFLSEKGEAAKPEKVLVYDLGGGTFDVTLMEIIGSRFTTLATAGDVYLGGIDWDQRLLVFCLQQINKESGNDYSEDTNFLERLLSQCIRAKKSLTARSETVIRIDHDGSRYSIPISRQQFEDMTVDLLERTRLTTEMVLRDAGIDWRELTKLLLVGGSTRMPMVSNMLERMSGLSLDRSLSPDEAVAHGAAIYAGILLQHGIDSLSGLSITNVNSHDLGVLGLDPVSKKPKRKVLIPRNHPLPAQASKRFQSSKDGQKKIVVQIVEGGTEEGFGATTIGRCVIANLPNEIRRGTEVVVTFNYLSSGRLEVTADVPTLELSASSEIDRVSGMNQRDIERWKAKLDLRISSLLPDLAGANEVPETSAADGKKPESISRSVSKVVLESSSAKDFVHTGEPGSDALGSAQAIAEDEFSTDQHSGVFVFGDEEPKPLVGASFLNAIGETQNDSQKQDSIGTSALDFLADNQPPKAIPGDSVLDFLIELNDQPAAADDDDLALGDFLRELKEKE